MAVINVFWMILVVAFISQEAATSALSKRDAGKKVRVTTVLTPPFMMSKPEGGHTGNDRYEGYVKDLLDIIAEAVGNFDYEIHEAPDGKYGGLQEDNTWNGMIGELIKDEADIAAAPLTITRARDAVIDFTRPFMNLGISMLMKKPQESKSTAFQRAEDVLAPFSTELWIYIIVAYIGMSMALFIIGRFNDWERRGNYEENLLTFSNSLWFNFGIPGKAGSELAPKAISTRIVSAAWWIFSFFLLGAYVTRMYMFLTVERMIMPVTNVDELSKQTMIKYGTVFRGSTYTFFKDSQIPTYQRMWRFMSSTRPSAFVNRTDEGVNRVKKGNYVFFTESTLIDYFTNRDCDLMRVGGLLDSKGYGLAAPIGSHFIKLINGALLRNFEDGRMHMLFLKWFRNNPDPCDTYIKPSASNSISVTEFAGPFTIAVCGIALAVLVAICECLCQARKRSKENKVSFKSQLSSDMRRCGTSCCKVTRPLEQPPEENIQITAKD